MIPPPAVCRRCPTGAGRPIPQILIVEDEAAIADTLIYALQAESFLTQWSSLAGEALTLLENGAFDLTDTLAPKSTAGPIKGVVDSSVCTAGVCVWVTNTARIVYPPIL